jgi:hypothetical protein
MDTYQAMLFLHIVSLGIGFGAAAVMAVCTFQVRAAKTLADAAPFGAIAGKTEKVFPIAIVGLFATGAYMTSDVWTWSTGWIVVSIVGLAVVSLQGPLVAGRAAKKLKSALVENGPGPLGPVARSLTRQPALWIPEFSNLGMVLGIVWNMTHKPGTGEAIAAIVIGYAAGALFATRFTSRLAADATTAAADPTG